MWQRLLLTLSRALEVTPFIAACAALLAAGVAYKSSQDSVRAQYVSLAIAVLQGPKKPISERTPPEVDLRAWAVQVLQENSPVPLPRSVTTQWSTGGGLDLGKITFDEARKTFQFEMYDRKDDGRCKQSEQ